jgi:hypothetical protein
MKKTVLTFGFLSGGVAALMMFATVPFIDRIGFDKGALVGYTAMVISFMFVFFGIRSYRDNVLGGRIAFGRAFGVGLLITLISCVCYVVAWQIVYDNFMPDFMDRYAAYLIEGLKAKGASAAEIGATEQQMAEFKVMYANPFVRFGLTFIEPLPVGLLITMVSAIVLRKK